MRTAELTGARFACLEGCGFCCTFQPEANRLELGRLRKHFAPRPLPVTYSDDRTFLRLQGGCGACVMNERRACTVYELRPAHCRYFPFHVHFAEEPEVYVNYTCRGVERDVPGDLSESFRTSVLVNASQDDIKQHEQAAREAYATFRRLARYHDAWGDADATLAKLLPEGGKLFTTKRVERLADAADLDTDVDALHQEGLEPFGVADVARRPFYLAPDLRWLTFERDGPGALNVLEMDEKGQLTPAGRMDGLEAWQELDLPLRKGLAAYVSRLATRRAFIGQVYAIVDEDEFETTVEEATHARVLEIVCDLALRARMLAALGTPADRLPDEVARFYDTTFLDAPAIGGFL